MLPGMDPLLDQIDPRLISDMLLRVLEKLLKHHAVPNIPDGLGWTVLHMVMDKVL